MSTTKITDNLNSHQCEKKKTGVEVKQFSMEDLYEVKILNQNRVTKTKRNDTELPFFLNLNPKSILDKPLRPSIIKPTANVGPLDVRQSLEYLNPIRSPTFKQYDVPSEDEWNLRRKKFEPGPGSFNPNFSYYEQTRGGYFSKNHGCTSTNATSNTDLATSHIGPGYYKVTIGKFSQNRSANSGLFSKLPNVNSTERAYRRGLNSGEPMFIFSKRDKRCAVNYNIPPKNPKTASSLTPGPTSYDPNACGSFGTKGGFKIRKETKVTKLVKKMKMLLNNPNEYYVELGQDKDFGTNQKYAKPSKLFIIQNALEICQKKILQILDEASKKESKRQKLQELQRKKLSRLNNNEEFNSRHFQMLGQEEKYNADRKIVERKIKNLLIKQERLRHIYKKLVQKNNVGSVIKSDKKIVCINNKRTSYTSDLDRWLEDMKMTSFVTEKYHSSTNSSEKLYVVEDNVDGVRDNNRRISSTNDYYDKMGNILQNNGAVFWQTSSV